MHICIIDGSFIFAHERIKPPGGYYQSENWNRKELKFQFAVGQAMHTDLTIDVLPSALPGETMYSLISRIGGLNGHSSGAELCKSLLGSNDDLRVGDATVDLEHFNKATQNAYFGAGHFQSGLTTIDFFARLGTTPHIESIHTKPQAPSSLFDTPEGVQPGLVEIAHGHGHIFRWCVDCIDHDISQYGTAYWHVAHQLPATTVCIEHQRPLLEVVIPFRMRQQGFLRPMSLPRHILELARPAVQSTSSIAYGLSVMARDILLKTFPASDHQTVQGALMDGLADNGFLSRKGAIRQAAFVDGLSSFYQALADTAAFLPFLSFPALKRLSKALEGKANPIPATVTLMLGYWLFQSWDLFSSKIRWRRATTTSNPLEEERRLLAKPTPAQSGVTPLEHHRKVCIDFLLVHPSAGRSDFWRNHQRSCRWLARYDSAWLEASLPVDRLNKPTQLELFAG